MDRRRFLLTSLVAGFVRPVASVDAQPSANVPKIGYLSRGGAA